MVVEARYVRHDADEQMGVDEDGPLERVLHGRQQVDDHVVTALERMAHLVGRSEADECARGKRAVEGHLELMAKGVEPRGRDVAHLIHGDLGVGVERVDAPGEGLLARARGGGLVQEGAVRLREDLGELGDEEVCDAQPLVGVGERADGGARREDEVEERGEGTDAEAKHAWERRRRRRPWRRTGGVGRRRTRSKGRRGARVGWLVGGLGSGRSYSAHRRRWASP